MWFKRRKKTEQDQALSQSLRSLQSLLNDSDRREPSLDGGHHPESNPEASDQPGEPSVEPRRRPAAPSLNTDERTQPSVLKEPAPPDSASRWRDLSLSFDAEPVVTPSRSRQDRDDDEELPDVEPDDELPESEPEQGAAGRTGENEPPEQAIDDSPDEEEHDILEESTGDEDVDQTLAVEAPAPDDNVEPARPAYDYEDDDEEDAEVRESNDAGDGADDIVEQYHDTAAIDDNDAAPEPVLVTDDTLVDFEAFSRPPGGPPADDGSVESQTLEGGVDEAAAADDDLPEFEWETPAPPADVQEHPARDEKADAGEPAEDQLYLELEPVDDDSEDAIPTLTEAVYVPDTVDTTAAAPPEVEQQGEDIETPVEPVDDESAVLRTIERLRIRLQLMGLDELSREQEAQLRETLEEFMDEMKDDASGH